MYMLRHVKIILFRKVNNYMLTFLQTDSIHFDFHPGGSVAE